MTLALALAAVLLLLPAAPAASQDAPLVYVDPGHGGDVAGVVVGDLVEKDLVLRLGLVLTEAFQAAGWDTRMSRTGDEASGFEERVAEAEALGADLFLSLHMTQDEDPDEFGTELFLAEELPHAVAAAQAIAGELEAMGGRATLIGQPWDVLKSEAFPTVMVELGHLTHPVERRLLTSPDYWEDVSEALVRAAAEIVGPARAPAQPGDTVDVLFLGNSYVYYNNLADQLQAMSDGLPHGPYLRTAHHLHGGFSLRRHLDDGHVPGVLAGPTPDALPWDRVVVQEHSRLGVPYASEEDGTLGDPTPFRTAVADVVERVRARGSEPVLYMTWAKEAFPDQIGTLAAEYRGAGERLDVPVVPVGIAWDRVRSERPELGLFHPDGSHPSAVGTYLTASVMYAALTGRSPVGAPTRLMGIAMETPGVVVSPDPVVLVELDAETAAYLQRVAWETVRAEAAR